MSYALLALGLFLLVFISGLGIFLLYLGYELWFHNQKLRVGYLPSYLPALAPRLHEIMNHYSDEELDGYEFVELGCGTGHVLSFFREHYPCARYTGVELDIGWYLLAKFRHRKFANTTIVRGNVLNYAPDSTTPRLVYAYLLPEILGELHRLGRFENTLLITLSFEIPEVAYTEFYRSSNLQHGLYVYDFRGGDVGGQQAAQKG